MVTLQKICEKEEEQVWTGSGIKPQGNCFMRTTHSGGKKPIRITHDSKLKPKLFKIAKS